MRVDTSDRRRLWAAVFLCTTLSGCFIPGNPNKVPDPTMPATVIRVVPDRPWTDSGLVVKKGDSIFFTATGEVVWATRITRSSADGIKGSPGWHVGEGGLVGRVDDSKAFDIGARVGLFPDRHARPPHHPFPPPPLRMPRDGKLLLGFKAFMPGENKGNFEVTIRYERRRDSSLPPNGR